MSSAELIRRLGDARVNVARVNDIGEAADHPQLAAIGAVLELPLGTGTMKAAASPFALFGAATGPDRPPPALAADRASILADLAFTDEDVRALAAGGAFGPADAQGGG